MKVLKTKQVNIAICWNGIRNTPPKDFPSVEEMEKTADLLDTLKESIPEFSKVLEEGEKLNTDIQAGKLKPDELMEKKTDFQKRSNSLEQEKGEQEISIEFETDAFNTLFQQFERWGREWFFKLEPYLAFRKDLNTTNQQPKKPEESKKGK